MTKSTRIFKASLTSGRNKLNLGVFRNVALILLAAAVFAFSLSPLAEASNNLSYSYLSRKPIPQGRLVSLVAKDSGAGKLVEPANTDNAGRLIGVTVDVKKSLLAVEPGKTTVQVAVSGILPTAVSNLNGPIKKGDKIAASPLNGIGMKAPANSEVIGVAQKDFGSGSENVSTREVRDKSGKSVKVKVGFVPAVINIGQNAASGEKEDSGAYQNLVSFLAGHRVSITQATIAGAIVLVTIIAMIVLVGGAVRGSLVSIGRNPLAKNSILTASAQILAMTALLALLAIIALFLVLS